MEKLLNARIAFGDFVKFPQENWQQKYCEGLKKIADFYGVEEGQLAKAFMEYYMPSIVIGLTDNVLLP